MHAELLSSLAAERHRDLLSGASRRRVPPPGALPAQAAPALALVPVPALRPRGLRAPGRLLPGLRISWSRTTLAAATSRGRGRSWVIVIPATRPL
jgi:hypothetical protein